MLFTQSLQSETSPTSSQRKTYPDERDQIEIFVSCKDLKIPSISPGGISIVVSLFTERNGVFELAAETEKQTKNLSNPNFTRSFLLDFFFAVQQNLKFVIKLVSRGSERIIGEIRTSLGRIVGNTDEKIVYEIPSNLHYNRESIGKFILRHESVAYVSHTANMMIKAVDLKLPRKSILKKRENEFVLRLSRPVGDKSYGLTYESEVRQGENPRWYVVQIGIQKLCNGDYNKKIQLQITSYASGSVIGEAYFTINELLSDLSIDHQIDLLCPITGKTCSKVLICDFELTEKPHFLDYLRSGLKFNFLLGIDYTSSNKEPSNPDSLHYNKPEGLNEYEKAISGVFDILLNYNKRKEVSMFGFGGIPKFPNCESTLTHHCFPLTGEYAHPSAFGLDGILKVYRNSLNQVQMASPSYLEPIINLTKQMALQISVKEQNEYTILIILTDGKCHDMRDTINAVIESSGLPLSIIVVGVGDGDFKKMEILDGAQGLVNNRGGMTERDLVQFVPFEKLQHNPDLLAKYVLKKIPEQVVEYMVGSGKYPKSEVLSRILKVEATEDNLDKLIWECGYEDYLMSQEKNRSFSSMTTQSEITNNLNNGVLKAFELLKIKTEKSSIQVKTTCSFSDEEDTTTGDDEDDLQLYQKDKNFYAFSSTHERTFGNMSKTLDMLKNKTVY